MGDKQITNIIHRTPWRPPIASSAKGIKIYLQDGREIIDGSGGAAVAALGMGHPEIVKAIQEQAAKMAYVYNMQLSNEPAEELASLLCSTSNGAFEMCTFVSGGSEATDSALKLARQVRIFNDPTIDPSQRIVFSIGLRLDSPNARIS